MRVREGRILLEPACRADLYARLDYADESTGPKHRATFDEYAIQKRLTDAEIRLAIQCAEELKKGMPVDEMVEASGLRWVRQIYILEGSAKLMEGAGYYCALRRGERGAHRWRKQLPEHLQIRKRNPNDRREILVADPEEKRRQVEVLRSLYEKTGQTPRVAVLISTLWPRVVPEVGRRRIWVQWVQPGDPNESVPMMMSHQWRRYFDAAGVPIVQQLAHAMDSADRRSLETHLADRARLEGIIRRLYQERGRHPVNVEIYKAIHPEKKLSAYNMDRTVRFQIRRLYANGYDDLCECAGIPLPEDSC